MAGPDSDALSDIDEADFLNGGGGDDVIVAGQNDQVHGGSGADQIVLGDWIENGASAAISDFEPEDDSLLFVWDDSDTEAEVPEIAVRPDPDHAGQLQVWMGDQVLAQVSGQSELSTADIALIPLSSAVTLGLAGS
ncbi:hypothetical protein [Sulfitobacter sediminilitoris]|uniref:hypothetical protein n=1 Tax=Sulfitobacter sediminilitoris TaxID=2698830 RepID=UPI002E289022|nr:hypothetical protein [Sulfitobacter sediminilitoris]